MRKSLVLKSTREHNVGHEPDSFAWFILLGGFHLKRFFSYVSVFIFGFLGITAPVASSAPKPKVELILVETNKWDKNCFGSFYSVTIDLSTKPPQYFCGLLTLINQKTAGTRHFQIFENGDWVDLESSSSWILTSVSYLNSKGVSTYSEKINRPKLQGYNFGRVVSNSKYRYLGEVKSFGADWLAVPLPYSQEQLPGKPVFDPSITELKVRSKVVTKGKAIFSNSVLIVFKNHNFWSYGQSFGTWSETSPGATQSGSTPKNISPSTSSQKICTASSATVKASIGSDNSQGYSIDAVVFQNMSDCNVAVSAAITVVCPTGGVLDLSITTRTVGSFPIAPRKEIAVNGLNLRSYFPQVLQDCYVRTGFRANLVQISTLFGSAPSARVLSATP
jgi:hypothetical protein